MRKRFFRKRIPLIIILVLAISTLALASDNTINKTKGKVTTVNLEKKILVVYESEYFWNQDTIFSDEKGTPITIKEMKPNAWVYILWNYVKGSKKKIAKNVYLLKEER